ncbi:MAG TPA: sulfur carrier protein ThiS [Burkholderiaceae bacterium]|nr:sulfur carrier protein ThiS [Burkholderiaceae bacterium]
MNITLNGETRRIDPGLTVSGLMEQLGFQGKRIAVERNGEIVPRSAHAATELAEGDTLEVVVAVGGG